MVLIPIAPDLKDDPKTNDRYFDLVISRIEKQIGVKFKDNIVFRRDFATSDFIKDYNSFKGNAYGLANTLSQTAILKPKLIIIEDGHYSSRTAMLLAAKTLKIKTLLELFRV